MPYLPLIQAFVPMEQLPAWGVHVQMGFAQETNSNLWWKGLVQEKHEKQWGLGQPLGKCYPEGFAVRVLLPANYQQPDPACSLSPAPGGSQMSPAGRWHCNQTHWGNTWPKVADRGFHRSFFPAQRGSAQCLGTGWAEAMSPSPSPSPS